MAEASDSVWDDIDSGRAAGHYAHFLSRRSRPGLVRTGRCIDAAVREHEPLHRAAIDQVGLDDLFDIAGRYESVPDSVGINHDGWAVFALIQTTRFIHANGRFQARILNLVLEEWQEFAFAIICAASSGASRLTDVGTDENMVLKLCQAIGLPGGVVSLSYRAEPQRLKGLG